MLSLRTPKVRSHELGRDVLTQNFPDQQCLEDYRTFSAMDSPTANILRSDECAFLCGCRGLWITSLGGPVSAC
jgi:hypothetical protein